MGTEDAARDLDVARLVQCAAGGDRQAWARLVGHCERLIGAITSDSTLDESDAAAIAQVAWLGLSERLQLFRRCDRAAPRQAAAS